MAMADQERRHVAQLKQELDQERSLRKQFHRDKVDTSYTFFFLTVAYTNLFMRYRYAK